MNDGLIPNRYAKALFKFALQLGLTSEVYEQAKSLQAQLAASKQLRQLACNPFVAFDEKRSLLLAAAGAQPGGPLDKFFSLVNHNNRVEFLQAMALSYIKLYRQHYGIARVEVETASALPQAELDKIVAVVKSQLHQQKLELSTRVNPELIGGFRVTVDSLELDASVKNQLEKLRLKLLSK